MRPAATFLAALGPLFVAATALAGERDTPAEPEARRTTEDRAFVYSVDPTTPSLGTVTAESSIGVGSGVAALRPLPSASDAHGAHTAESSVTLSGGLGGGFAPFVTGIRGFGDGASGVGLVAGLRYQLPTGDGPFHAGIVGAGFREPGGAFGGYARITGTYDVDRLRLGGNLHVEHVFGAGRDGADFVVSLGASYRVIPGLRLGAEYVGQDLEELGAPAAEGGAKQYAGPTFAIDLDRGRAQIVAGPAFGLGGNSARVLGRASIVVSF
jgi:hypothetical protein